MGNWWQNCPETLQQIAMKYCIRQLTTFVHYYTETWSDDVDLKGLVMPSNICDAIFGEVLHKKIYPRAASHSMDKISDMVDVFVEMFADPEKTHLRKVHFLYLPISGSTLKDAMVHKLTELTLPAPHRGSIYGKNFIEIINEHGQNLRRLKMLDVRQIFSPHFDSTFTRRSNGNEAVFGRDYILKCPQLCQLSLHCFTSEYSHLMEPLFRNLDKLTHIDLSHSSPVCIENLDCLQKLTGLISLVLYDVEMKMEQAFKMIGGCKKLRHLDVSKPRPDSELSALLVEKINSTNNMQELLKNLPDLVSLDISGTHLAGHFKGNVEDDRDGSQKLTDALFTKKMCYTAALSPPEGAGDAPLSECQFPGLEGRMFEFLGLLDCPHNACSRKNIPAIKVTGSANEQQIMTAVQVYSERPKMLHSALNHLFENAQNGEIKDLKTALLAVLDALERNFEHDNVQLAGSASLFFILKELLENEDMPIKLKRRVLSTLLDVISYQATENTTLRNVLLVICQFKIPDDVLFMYNRMVKFLVKVVLKENQQPQLSHFGIILLNALACSVTYQQKLILGKRGAIKKMLSLIRFGVIRSSYDELMEPMWSTLWNATDETEYNCTQFVDNHGLDYFKKSVERFSDKANLMRNMMGLLGNVSEVKNLRHHLMTAPLIEIFRDLLKSPSDGIEVSYNACGVLAHIMSDGPIAWHHLPIPGRNVVLEDMKVAIRQWNIDSQRNINYRSFGPILCLLSCYHTPEVQHWAVWALANLTKVYPGKYCKLLLKEGGPGRLEEIISDPRPYDDIKELANSVVDRCKEVELDPKDSIDDSTGTITYSEHIPGLDGDNDDSNDET